MTGAVSLRAACRRDRGPRASDEDRCLVREDVGLYAVADGMGGWLRGAEAATAVVTALAGLAPAPLEDLAAAVERALAEVNRELQAAALREGPSGTTVVVLLCDGRRFRVLWAGDSRAGLLRGGTLRWLTTDHNLAALAVRQGRMDDETARRGPLASRLTRALGVGPEPELDVVAGTVAPGDVFLLCSDGLTGALDDAVIRGVLADAADPETTAERLVARALADPRCHDNVTALVVRAG